MNRAPHENLFHRAVYLTGPTAAGKTAVGVALARRLGAEVVALDSTTLYRGMDISTAKPTTTERGGIPHHLIDVVEPWDSATVAGYREWARAAVQAIEQRGGQVLFVGGSALYLKALVRGLFQGPGADAALRLRLERDAGERGDAALHARLAAIDPVTAARLHPHDRRRVIRALEVIELTGRPISLLQAEHGRPAPATVPIFALDLPRPALRERINRRVLGFFDAGLVEEVRSLQAAPRPLGDVAAQAIGYREIIAMLAGKADLGQTIEQIQARTRQFAKRQATWFRGLEEVRAFPISPDDHPETIAGRLAESIEGVRASFEPIAEGSPDGGPASERLAALLPLDLEPLAEAGVPGSKAPNLL
jgi:tRNA dimethylallyltransferase